MKHSRLFWITALCLLLCCLFAGCAAHEAEDSNAAEQSSAETTEQDPLLLCAYEVLDELPDNAQKDDFLTAVNIIRNLPDDAEGICAELEKVQAICDRYGVQLDAIPEILQNYALGEFDDSSFAHYEEAMAYEIWSLVDTLIYPQLFELYGEEAADIPGLTYADVQTSLSLAGAALEETSTNMLLQTTEKWRIMGDPAGLPEVTFYPNDRVSSVSLPLVLSEDLLTEAEYSAYLELPRAEQQAFAEERFAQILAQFAEFEYGTEILNAIFTAEELAVLKQYIASLTPADLWENDLYTGGQKVDERPGYDAVGIWLRYNDLHVQLRITFYRLEIRISAFEQINALTQRYYTLIVGFSGDSVLAADFDDYINGNTAANTAISASMIDLNAREEELLQAIEAAKQETSAKPETPDASNGSYTFAPAYLDEYGISWNYYTIELPKSWDGQFEVECNPEQAYGYSVYFYDKDERENGYGGFLFAIRLLQDASEYDFLPAYSVLGYADVYRIGGYHVVAVFPTDVQFGGADSDYMIMSGEIDAILESVRFNEETEFQKT